MGKSGSRMLSLKITELIQGYLKSFVETLGAQDVVLFERGTFSSCTSFTSLTNRYLQPPTIGKAVLHHKEFQIVMLVCPHPVRCSCSLSIHVTSGASGTDFAGQKVEFRI